MSVSIANATFCPVPAEFLPLPLPSRLTLSEELLRVSFFCAQRVQCPWTLASLAEWLDEKKGVPGASNRRQLGDANKRGRAASALQGQPSSAEECRPRCIGASRDAKCRYGTGWESEHPTTYPGIQQWHTPGPVSTVELTSARPSGPCSASSWRGPLWQAEHAPVDSGLDIQGSERCTWALGVLATTTTTVQETMSPPTAAMPRGRRLKCNSLLCHRLCSSPWLSSRLASWPRHSFHLSSSPTSSSACPAPPSSPGMAPSRARAASATRPRACLLPIALPMTK